MKALAKEVDEDKVKIEQEKLSKDESAEDVSVWGSEIEAKLELVDAEAMNLSKWLNKGQQQTSMTGKESNEALVAKERQQQLDFERAQLELR